MVGCGVVIFLLFYRDGESHFLALGPLIFSSFRYSFDSFILLVLGLLSVNHLDCVDFFSLIFSAAFVNLDSFYCWYVTHVLTDKQIPSTVFTAITEVELSASVRTVVSLGGLGAVKM